MSKGAGVGCLMRDRPCDPRRVIKVIVENRSPFLIRRARVPQQAAFMQAGNTVTLLRHLYEVPAYD